MKIRIICKKAWSCFQQKDSNVKALLLTNLLGNILRLTSNLILARMLSPEVFAITGLAMSIIVALELISDGGFRGFTLRHKDGDKSDFLKTIWTIRFIRNLILATLLFFASPSIALFFDIAALDNVLKVMAFIFIIGGFIQSGYFSLERAYRVSTVLYIRFICNILSIIFMIVGVYFFRNYWPIVLSMLVNYALQVLFGYIYIGNRGTGFALNKKVYMEFFHWAKYVIPSSMITLALTQLDKVILGKKLSMTELGLYFVAFSLSVAVATLCIQYCRNVLQPFMSIVFRTEPANFSARYYEKKMKVSLVLAFGIGLLTGASTLFFDLLYDDRYLSSGYYLSYLLIPSIFILFTYSSEVLLVVRGEVKATLTTNCLRLAWLPLAMWYGYEWLGIQGLLIAISLAEMPAAIYLTIRLSKLGLLNIKKDALIFCVAAVGFLSAYLPLTAINN